MKKFAILLVFSLITFGCGLKNSTPADYPDINGKKYIGEPGSETSFSGCEGCGQEGYFKFSENNEVEFIWPGGDIINSGTYKQQKEVIEINSIYKGTYYFTLSKDGKEITDNEYGRIFREEKHP